MSHNALFSVLLILSLTPAVFGNYSLVTQKEQNTLFGDEKRTKLFDEELKFYLQEKLAEYSSWVIDEVAWGKKVENSEYSIDNSRKFILNGAFGYIPVFVKSSSGQLKTILTVRLKLTIKGLVSKKEIKVNTDFDALDFELKEVDPVGLHGQVISDFRELTKYRSKMYIKEGSCLTEQMVRGRALIKHGEPATCYIKKGGIVVSFDAIAWEDGCFGEIIRFMTKDKKLYRAKIESVDSAKIVE